MKTRKTVMVTMTAVLLASLLVDTSRVPRLLAKSEQFYAKIKIFTSILETIQRSYVEKQDPDELLENAIHGVLSNLDPHTVYLPVDDFKNWSSSFEGYTGIGISIEMLRDQVVIMSTLPASPAAEAGLSPGDEIVKVNGEPVRGATREGVLNKLTGPTGVPVNLLVASEKWTSPRELQLVRERIVLKSVPFATIVKKGIGYVKLDRFTSTTSRELDEALRRLKRKGMKRLVLDLRGNSGGYLNAAVEVADKFIPGGNIIVSTKGRLSSSFQQFYSTSEKTHDLNPIIVLIDHGSASASEIVAGAIQDLDRGLILGKTSFGKGLVQSQYRFHDGSALLITTARYYTPSGRPIQRKFFDKSKDEYYREAYNDSLMKNIKAANAKQPYKTRLGRKVHAEGGIRPDYWIENRENELSEPLRELYFSEARYFYLFGEEIIKKSPHLKSNQETFVNNFTVSDKMANDFLQFAKYYEPSLLSHELASSRNKKDIRFLLKREIGYMIWGTEARFRINLARDHQLNEALSYFPKAHDLLSMAHFVN